MDQIDEYLAWLRECRDERAEDLQQFEEVWRPKTDQQLKAEIQREIEYFDGLIAKHLKR